jgi:hypothetical protein
LALSAVTPLVVAVVIGLIADLDDPYTGLIRVEQNSMNRLANRHWPALTMPDRHAAYPVACSQPVSALLAGNFG